MANPTAKAALFDVSDFTRRTVDGDIERVPLDELELARNPRTEIDQAGIERLARMLMSMGQLVPLIGQRIDDGRVLVYDGQRRLLAARASEALADSEAFEGLKPVRALIVVLLDHEPTADEIRRIQAQAKAREDLSRRDQQEQFRDCWQARAALPDADRMVVVCQDLGISTSKGHYLRREIELPEAIRHRVSERPTGEGISVTMAGRLSEMHQTAPELTSAVAARLTSRDLHDRALQDMGAFVHRTVVEDESVYAVRIEDGSLLDAHNHIEIARRHLTAGQLEQLTRLLECNDVAAVDAALDALAAKARSKALKIRVDAHLRDRAANGNYAYAYHRGPDIAPTVWIIDPLFTIGLVNERLKDTDDSVAAEERFFGGAGLHDDELRDAAHAVRARRAAERTRQQQAANANLGLGHDIRAGLMDPTEQQLHALNALVCHLLAEPYGELIAYGAGWTDPANMQPVGDSRRLEPRQSDVIVAAELQRALDDKDPLRGIAQLAARLCAAFVLDPDGVTKTKALGAERMARRLRDAMPGGEHPLRAAVWALMRPMLSPHLTALNHDAFVVEHAPRSTVDLDAHRDDSALADLDLGDDDTHADAA
jgi:hypothetical protein